METISDSDKGIEDEWGWTGQLEAVQGFGFLPPRVIQELDNMTQVRPVVLYEPMPP